MTIGSAFILTAFVLFYATSAVGQFSVFSGREFIDENGPRSWPIPVAMWLIPLLLLGGGIACLYLHARQTPVLIEAEHTAGELPDLGPGEA